MGFIDDKTDLFSEISVVKAIEDNFPELNKTINNFNSVKSSDGNVITLLLDLLKSLVDEAEIKKQFTEILGKTDAFEEQIKTTVAQTLLDTYTRNFDFQLPSGTIMSTDIKNLDVKDTLKTNPNSELGKYSYGKDANVDFTRFLYNTTQSGSGTWNGMLDFSFNSSSGVVDIGFNSGFSNKGFEDFVFDFINSIRIIDPSMLLSTILDTMFGSISSLSDAGEQWILEQLKMAETMNKIISTESLNDTVIYDDSFFEFSPEQMNSISAKMEGLSNGTHLSNLGCGFGESFIDLDSFGEAFDQINDIRPSLVKQATTNFTNKLMSQSTVGVSDENRRNVEFNLLKEIFENLPNIFMGMTINPSITMMFQLSETMINGNPLDLAVTSLTESPIGVLIRSLKESIVCIIKIIYSLIVEFLFDRVKAEITKLAAVLFAKIAKDQLQNYQAILTTIRNLLEQVNNIFSLINGD